MEHKIIAELDGENININAKFFRGKDVVHEINHAFPVGTSEEVIREAVVKAGELFELEEKQKEARKEEDEKNAEAKKVVNNLNS